MASWYASLYGSLGVTFRLLGQKEEASEYLERGRALAEGLPDDDYGRMVRQAIASKLRLLAEDGWRCAAVRGIVKAVSRSLSQAVSYVAWIRAVMASSPPSIGVECETGASPLGSIGSGAIMPPSLIWTTDPS